LEFKESEFGRMVIVEFDGVRHKVVGIEAWAGMTAINGQYMSVVSPKVDLLFPGSPLCLIVPAWMCPHRC
jgi:hypothetical protein